MIVRSLLALALLVSALVPTGIGICIGADGHMGVRLGAQGAMCPCDAANGNDASCPQDAADEHYGSGSIDPSDLPHDCFDSMSTVEAKAPGRAVPADLLSLFPLGALLVDHASREVHANAASRDGGSAHPLDSSPGLARQHAAMLRAIILIV